MLLRLLVLCGLLLLAAPAVAGAASRSQIVRDCESDGTLSGTYSPSELRDARDNLPSDATAYSDCADVLRSALAASARRRAGAAGAAGSPGSSGGGSAGAQPVLPNASTGSSEAGSGAGVDLNALDTEAGGRRTPIASEDDLSELRSIRENLPEVDVRGQRVVPGVQGVAGRAATATVPTSLAVALILLGATAVLALVPLVRRRVRARRAT